ncbi:MAG TPA: hypothetical protein VMY99_04340 [Nevskiaceae bacterium]|nr:hypothetical protein [Nevskiaceae bacterium]
MIEQLPQSVAEFSDHMAGHAAAHSARLHSALPDHLAGQVTETTRAIRDTLGVSETDTVVVFGEQPYGPGWQKVLGKRVLARAVTRDSGATTIETMASQDAVGSEIGLRACTLPSAQKPDGVLSVRLLPNWKKVSANAAITVPSPTPEQLQTIRQSIGNLYNPGAADDFLDRIETAYTADSDSYGRANTAILRGYETRLGIEGDQLVHDGYLDTLIAQKGGLQALLQLWPQFVRAAANHATPTVRAPASHEAPFYLYHDECGGRMSVATHTDNPSTPTMETPLAACCLQCAHTETIAPADIVAQGRTLTFRAMARVAAYSLFRVGDGHITGGGSAYNQPVKAALKQLNLPYWPIMHMAVVNRQGEPSALFDYQSAATTKRRASSQPGYTPMVAALQQGNVSMADLEISTTPAQVRSAIQESLQHPGAFGPHSRINVRQQAGLHG